MTYLEILEMHSCLSMDDEHDRKVLAKNLDRLIRAHIYPHLAQRGRAKRYWAPYEVTENLHPKESNK